MRQALRRLRPGLPQPRALLARHRAAPGTTPMASSPAGGRAYSYRMPMQAFLQRVQAFLAELKARPHLLLEAAALMEREGGLEQMEPLLDWVSQEVFALQDGPSRPTSVDPPLVRAESAPVEEETGPSAPEGEPEAEAPLSPTSPARTPTEEVESEEEAARDESRQVGMNPAHAEAPKTPLNRLSGPPVSYGPQKPYVGSAPLETDRVPPPAAAATDQDQAGEGGHSGEGQRSPEAELKPPPAEQPKTFYPPKRGERVPAGPTPAGTPRQSSRPPADGEPLSAEETARLQQEDEHFRAWRHFEHRQSASQSDRPEQFKPTWAKAQADPAFRADLERGATRHEAFKRYKSRVRAAGKQHAAGPPPVSLKVSRGPAMQSQGGLHRRTVMSRLHSLALAGFEPTNEEYSQAVTMEHLADLVAQRAAEASDQADTGQPEAAPGPGQADTSRARARSRSRGGP